VNVASRPEKPVLLYIADPMCSWCWGFSPVIQEIQEQFGDACQVRLIAGGLYPGTQEAMGEGFRSTVREHWQHVNERTGQPFDFDFFERERFVYNTEPPCRALVAARHLKPGAELDLLARLHAAFYRDNRDITETSTIMAVAEEAGLDPAAFREAFESEAIKNETVEDFNLAQELGMLGLPTLLGYDGGDIKVMTEGYRSWPAVRARIDGMLNPERAG